MFSICGNVKRIILSVITQLEFTSKLVKELVGNFSYLKRPGPNPCYRLPVVRSQGHENVNILNRNIKQRRRCEYCSKGENKKNSNFRKEIVYGYAECEVRFCPDSCHDLYHQALQL